MKRRAFLLTACLALVFLAFSAAAALAHGGEEHVIGTLAQVTPASITVKTTAGKLVTVSVAPESKFLKNKAGATLTDLQVGNRVVIHAKEPEEGHLVADTVEFSSVKAPSAVKTPAQ